jgi:hypothetical protein
VSALLMCSGLSLAVAQSKDAPLTSQELVKLIYQLPKQPEKKDEVVEEIRRRGIGFALTDGMRSLVASKSGNDATLKRTLEEAERRRANPVAAALPGEAEAQALLEKTRVAIKAATAAMPDFVVKQLVSRSYALANTHNWQTVDRLALAVSYRAQYGEEYKVLAINGVPPNKEMPEGGDYMEQVGGSTSSGEFASILAQTFDETRHVSFKMLDTDELRGRRVLVYEYQVEKEFSALHVHLGDLSGIVAYHGRMWIDRELNRVLRFETVVDPPESFHTTAASQLVDYDWVSIADQKYLLPVQAEVLMTIPDNREIVTSRNLIRFHGYQKYGTDVKIIEEDIVDDPPPEKP